MWFRSLSGHRQLGSRASKTPCLKIILGTFAPHQVLWSECSTNLVMQMSNAAGWDYYLALQVWTWYAKICCCLLQAPPSFSIPIRFPVVESHRFPYNSHGVRSGEGFQQMTHIARGGMPIVFSTFFLTGGTRGQKTPLHMVLHRPGGGQYNKYVAASLVLLLQSILISVVQEVFQCSMILSMVLCSSIVC